MTSLVFPFEETFQDCAGRILRFEIRRGPQTDGVAVTAHQLDPEHWPGYKFSSWSATLGDALGRLRAKIRAGISRRYLGEHQQLGLSLLTNRLAGEIGSGGVIVDGRHIPFDRLIDLLQIHEGGSIYLHITDGYE